MTIEQDRSKLIDQLSKIGFIPSIREGYFDNIFTGGTPGSPEENTFAIRELEKRVETHDTSLTELETMAGKNDVRIKSVAELSQRQDVALKVQADEIERLNDTIVVNQANHVVIDSRLAGHDTEIAALKSEVSGYDARIDSHDTVNATQNTRLDELEGLVTGTQPGGLSDIREQLEQKVSLEDGKIPLNLLPELPTGRKVTVANSTERLALGEHADITIAYQTDDGRAYILGAAAIANVPANWQVLGNTSSSGVTSFNSRAGVVMPQVGDYTTNMINPTTERQYMSTNDRTRWDGKAENAYVIATVNGLRTEVANEYVKGKPQDFVSALDSTVVRRQELGKMNGIATLGADGKVIPSQLPTTSPAQESRLKAVEELAKLADQKGDIAADNSVTLDNRLQYETGRVDALRGRVSTLESFRTSDKTLIDANTAKNTVQDDRIKALEERPSGGAGTPRKYNNVRSSRAFNTYYQNNSDNEMAVLVTSNRAATIRQLRAYIREIGTTTIFVVTSPYVGVSADMDQQLTLAVPKGWEYQLVVGTGHSGIATITTWYELV